MKLFTYAKLLVESNLTPDSFGRKIKAAIETIFNVDDVKLTRLKDLNPPSFAHSYLSVALFFNYRNVPFRTVVHFYHLKFPSNELKKLSNQEWTDMLKTADLMSTIETPDDILKSANIQVKLTASLSYYPNQDIEAGLGLDEHENNYIGLVKSNNIRDLITKLKKLIDDFGGNDNNGPTEPEPVVPNEPIGKLVTV